MTLTGDPKKIKALYDDVKSEYEVGTLEDFEAYLDDDAKRAAFFKDVVQPRYEVGTLEEFEGTYGLKKKGFTEGATQQASNGSLPSVEDFASVYGVQSAQEPPLSQPSGVSRFKQGLKFKGTPVGAPQAAQSEPQIPQRETPSTQFDPLAANEAIANEDFANRSKSRAEKLYEERHGTEPSPYSDYREDPTQTLSKYDKYNTGEETVEDRVKLFNHMSRIEQSKAKEVNTGDYSDYTLALKASKDTAQPYMDDKGNLSEEGKVLRVSMANYLAKLKDEQPERYGTLSTDPDFKTLLSSIGAGEGEESELSKNPMAAFAEVMGKLDKKHGIVTEALLNQRDILEYDIRTKRADGYNKFGEATTLLSQTGILTEEKYREIQAATGVTDEGIAELEKMQDGVSYINMALFGKEQPTQADYDKGASELKKDRYALLTRVDDAADEYKSNRTTKAYSGDGVENIVKPFAAAFASLDKNLKMYPKAVADAFGAGSEYGWTDALYESSVAYDKYVNDPSVGMLEFQKAPLFPDKGGVNWRALPAKLSNAAGTMSQFAAAGFAGGVPAIVGLGYVSSVGDAYSEAIDAGLDPQTAGIVSNVIGAMVGVTETIMPDNKLMGGAVGSWKGSLIREIARNAGKYRTAGAIRAYAKDSFETAILKAGFKEGVLEEGTQAVGEDAIKYLVNKSEGTDFYKDLFNPNQIGEQIAIGAVMGKVMGGIGYVRGKPIDPTQAQLNTYVYDKLIKNPDPKFVQQFEEQAGENVKAATEYVTEWGKVYEATDKMEENDRLAITALETEKNALNEQNKSLSVPNPVVQARIEKIDSEIADITNRHAGRMNAKLAGTATEPQNVLVDGKQAVFFINEEGDYEFDFAEEGRNVVYSNGETAERVLGQLEIVPDTREVKEEDVVREQKSQLLSPTLEAGATVTHNDKDYTVEQFSSKDGKIVSIGLVDENGKTRRVRKGQSAADDKLLDDVNGIKKDETKDISTKDTKTETQETPAVEVLENGDTEDGTGGVVKSLNDVDRKKLEGNNFKEVDGMMMNTEGTRAWYKISDNTKQLLKKYGIHYIEGYVNFDHLKGGETKHGNLVKLKKGEANGIQVNVSSVGDKFNIENTILHELGHIVYEGLSSEQKKQLEREPITQHGKEVKKNVEDGGKTYKKEDIAEEDFAELFAEKEGDLKTIGQSLLPPLTPTATPEGAAASDEITQELEDLKNARQAEFDKSIHGVSLSSYENYRSRGGKDSTTAIQKAFGLRYKGAGEVADYFRENTRDSIEAKYESKIRAISEQITTPPPPPEIAGDEAGDVEPANDAQKGKVGDYINDSEKLDRRKLSEDGINLTSDEFSLLEQGNYFLAFPDANIQNILKNAEKLAQVDGEKRNNVHFAEAMQYETNTDSSVMDSYKRSIDYDVSNWIGGKTKKEIAARKERRESSIADTLKAAQRASNVLDVSPSEVAKYAAEKLESAGLQVPQDILDLQSKPTTDGTTTEQPQIVSTDGMGDGVAATESESGANVTPDASEQTEVSTTEPQLTRAQRAIKNAEAKPTFAEKLRAKKKVEQAPIETVAEVSETIEDKVEEITNSIPFETKSKAGQETLLKAQKKDILVQMEEVQDILLSKVTDKAQVRELLEKGTIENDWQRHVAAIKKAGYKVSKDGKVTFEVKNDGVFKLHLSTLVQSIDLVKKEFPDKVAGAPTVRSESLPRAPKKSLSDYETLSDAKEQYEDAKSNLETAKKETDAKKGFIPVMQKYFDEAEKIYSQAKNREASDRLDNFIETDKEFVANEARSVKLRKEADDLFQNRENGEISKELSDKVESLYAESKALDQKNRDIREKKRDEFSAQVEAESQETIADKIRSAKIKNKGQLNDALLGLPVATYNGMIEAAATAWDATKSIADAVAAAIKFVKGSDWYKGLSETEQQDAEDAIASEISGEEQPADQKKQAEQELLEQVGEEATEPAEMDTKETVSDFMKRGIEAGLGETEERSYTARRKKAGEKKIKEADYRTVDQKAMEKVAEQKFQQLKNRYEAGETGVFDELLEVFGATTQKEMSETAGLASLYQVTMAKAAYYFYKKGDVATYKKIRDTKGVAGTTAGQTAAALSQMSTVEELANRIIDEEQSRKDFLAQVHDGTMTVEEAIKELGKMSKLSKEELAALLDIKVPKRASGGTTVRTTFKQERTAIRERIKAKMPAGTLTIPIQIIPDILDLANSYLKEGVFTMQKVKDKVWNEIKDLFPGDRGELDKILDGNEKKFAQALKDNQEQRATSKLAKALEGNTADPNKQKKAALKIIADTILANDPDYVTAKNNKERVSAKERLKTILADKDAVAALITKALAIASAKVRSDTKLSPAQQQAIINQMEDMVAEITELPVNKAQQRAAAPTLSDEELKAEVERIATEHFTDPSGEITSFAEKLVEQLDIDPVYAETLQKQIEAKVEKAVQEKLDAQKERTEKMLAAIGAGTKNLKGVVAKAMSKGKISDTQFQEELLKALGYRGLSMSDIATLKNLMARLESLDAGEEIHSEVNKLINDILTEADETTAAMVGRWLVEQFYINALSNFMKTAITNSGIGAIISTVQHGTATMLYNPARFARARAHAKAMRKGKARPGWATVGAKWADSTRDFTETTQHDKPIERAHSAVTRVTTKEYREILDDLASKKNGRRFYYAVQLALKTASHIMGGGKQKNVKFPAYSQISTAIMSSQDLLQGAMMEDIFVYIESERYLDSLNKARKAAGRPIIPKGSQRWNDRMKILVDSGAANVATLTQEVNAEAAQRINNGEELAKGWKRRRLREKIHATLPKTVMDEATHQAKKALFLHKPESNLGSLIYKAISDKLIIHDKDSVVPAMIKTIGTMITGFMRLSIVAAELTYRTVPVLPVATYLGYGYKFRIIDGKRKRVPLTEEDKRRRVVSSMATSLAMYGLIMSVFDWDEEEDETGEKKWIMKLDPNAWLRFYGNGDDAEQRNRMAAEGASPNSMTIFGKNIPLTNAGFGLGSIGKILGEVSNDIRFAEKPSDAALTEVISIDDLVGLTTAQIMGTDYSPIEKTLRELYSYDPSALEAGETLLFDGIETALSPSILEALKKDFEAWKGIHKEKRDGVSDQIFSDIVFTDVFMDTNGGKLYDHFGQPVYVTPADPVLKALLPETVWKNGTDHIKNSPYYSLTDGEWHPTSYSRWDAEKWHWEENGKPRTLSEEQQDSIAREMDRRTAELINSRYKELEGMGKVKRIEELKEIRTQAIDQVSGEFVPEHEKGLNALLIRLHATFKSQNGRKANPAEATAIERQAKDEYARGK